MASLTTKAAASSSSSSLPLSSTDHQNHYTYEVFLSFRGEDTRSNFTDHLHSLLCDRGIETFIDDELKRGEEISSALVKAIEESRVSIIVFSQNYASSRWCLDELVKILECRKSKGQEVRAVFYKVDPSDVRHQRGAFGDAFAMLDQCKYKDSMDKWKAALREAADLSGWPFKDGESEAKFIRKIIGELSARVVNPSCELHVTEHPIGLESCRQDVNSLLHAEENIVRMVGIWGPGGIGKTTIAKDVFNSIRHKFACSCFLANVRSNALIQLQEKLLSHILRDSTLEVISSIDQGVSLIRTRMQNKKVLLILDDVSHSSQLQNLVPSPDCFGPGSRILITTRDKRWLIAHQVDEVYEVKMLNDHQALNLFSLNAFKRNGPPGNYLKLAQRAVRYAQGLPLALIVLGSHLFRRSREEWEATLDSCRGEDPHREIRDVLKISYDALGVDLKGYFLDIACFFKGKHVDDVKPILEACYDLKPVNGIAQLQEKALIKIDGDRIWMHDLIEEMGKDIVYQESPGEAGKRSRVWSEEDIIHVLTNNTGTNKVIGIQNSWWFSTISLNAKSFSKMKNLRYISMGENLKYKSFSGDIDYLSNQLRWLDWPNNPLQSFPSDFHANKLVKLNIPHSCGITQLWEERKNFPILTSMDLRGCKSLKDLPHFTGIPNLIELKLDGCESLVKAALTLLSYQPKLTSNLSMICI
ncbi:disease resistance protein RUN1-like [Rosa rugosa]|uniref:disease resistance protein RUN1-like n=1 Tax=Rosa rugosa TaxID=74645 RepID=UPI002B4016E5|nr:disease resistance protein RUN1-like [Rosa rugosa]